MNIPEWSFRDDDSELSDLGSNMSLNTVEDEIVGGGRDSKGGPKISVTLEDNTDKVIEDAPEESEDSHLPKRKRNSMLHDFRRRKSERVYSTAFERPTTSPANANKFMPGHQSLCVPGVKGILLGVWRDSNVVDEEKKHAVIGFINDRGSLRTRIQPNTKNGESLAEDYPLPSGPSGCWVTFERIIFSDHLVGLDYSQIKEYTRLRSKRSSEETEDGRVAAEHVAVQEAIRRVKENQASSSPVHPPTIAYGGHLPEHLQTPLWPGHKQRRAIGGFAVINPTTADAPESATISIPQKSTAALQTYPTIAPLPGTRPTCILIGHWKLSSEADPKDRHAVCGVLGRNDGFRVKVVRQTRDGRFVNGNYPSGAGALWIPYQEVEFEPHLKALNRQEVMEYCRVRQYQLDHGETSTERIENETKAVYEAQTRAGTIPGKQPQNGTLLTFSTSLRGNSDDLRQWRRKEPQFVQAAVGEDERHPSRLQSVGPEERSRTLTRRNIASAGVAQGQADRRATHGERAVAATSSMPAEHHPSANGRMPFQASEDKPHSKNNSGDVKMHDGDQYERKITGPFMGKFVSQGRVINIDGDDYVEYRILTKPSFF